MADLTEIEIFDCLTTNFRLAAEHCDDLAKLPRKGPTYTKLRDELKLIEGAARQAAYWRQDTRWLAIGKITEQAHHLAGSWLRGIRVKAGAPRVKIPAGQMHPCFVALGAALRHFEGFANHLRDDKTGKVGIILPTPLPGPHRDTRPVSMAVSRGGILMPQVQVVQ